MDGGERGVDSGVDEGGVIEMGKTVGCIMGTYDNAIWWSN